MLGITLCKGGSTDGIELVLSGTDEDQWAS